MTTAVTGAVLARQIALKEHDSLGQAPEHVPLYLPHVQYVRLLSLGYDSVLSRVLWFSTINYFGKQLMAGKDIRWLSHMCNLTVSLDPEPIDPIEFCATILPWMAKDPLQAERLLTVGIKRHPHYWRLPYMRGFTRWYFLENMKGALEDMTTASHAADAPAFVQTLASKMMAHNQSSSVARQFLQQMLERTKDPAAHAALDAEFKMAQLAEHLDFLKIAVERYQKRTGSAPKEINDLVTGHILNTIPTEPYGGEYVLDSVSGEPKTTSGRVPIHFAGKTAKTGIMAEEFADYQVPK